jgi:hypothetical protein
MNEPASDQRRFERKPANFSAVVTDMINGGPMGLLGNLSRTGVLVISKQTPCSEALYQVSVELSMGGDSPQPDSAIVIGIQEQWHATAASPGQIWAGYRIIAISDADSARLEAWLAQS